MTTTADVAKAPSATPALIRAVGAWGLTAAVANTVIGGGIFRLPSAMAAAVGPIAPLYYLACAVGVGAVAICFAEAGSRVAVSGGIAGCVETAFGRYFGFLTSAMLWLGCALAAGGIAAGIADALGAAVPVFKQVIWRDAFLLGLIASIAWINVRGVKAGARLVSVTIVVKLVPLLVLVIVGGVFGAAAPTPLTTPAKVEIGRAMILGVFAFMGMEGTMGVAGEVKRPERNIPLGILGTLGAVTVLYILIQLSTQHLLGEALNTSGAPLADAMARVSPALGALLIVGAAVSMAGYLTADMLTSPRFLFGMAHDRILPAVVGRVDPGSRSPRVAIGLHGVIVSALAISGAFSELVVLSTLAVILPYIIGCMAAVVLQRRKVAEVGAPMNFPLTPVAAAVGVVSMTWIALQGERNELTAMALAIVVASGLYLVAGRLSGRVTKRNPA